MTEGIEYLPTGTVDVTFDDNTYHLGRPKLKQWKYFTRKMDQITTKAQEDLAGLVRRLSDAQQAILEAADEVLRGTYELADERAQAEGATRAETQAREVAWSHVLEAADADLRKKYESAQKAITKFSEKPFYERSSELVKEIFSQLGDPLPDDIEEWPVWLATDVTLAGSLLAHWRSHPKASGPNGQM